jgi:AraC-like DNA-binding protein
MASKNQPLQRQEQKPGGGVHLDLLGRVCFPAGHRGAIHSHPFWEFIFIAGGQGQCLVDTIWQSCDPGTLILMPPGKKHQLKADNKQPLDQLYLGFSFDLATGLAEIQSNSPLEFPLTLTTLLKNELNHSYTLIRASKTGEIDNSTRIRLLQAVGRAIEFLLNSSSKSDGGSRSAFRKKSGNTLTQKIKEHLSANLQSSQTVLELAQHFCLSSAYLGEIFKSETGVTIKEYQRQARMEKALDWLQHSDQPIESIAQSLGIQDPAYFSRLFKSYYQQSPRQARSTFL